MIIDLNSSVYGRLFLATQKIEPTSSAQIAEIGADVAHRVPATTT
jgi:hypothetical protein